MYVKCFKCSKVLHKSYWLLLFRGGEDGVEREKGFTLGQWHWNLTKLYSERHDALLDSPSHSVLPLWLLFVTLFFLQNLNLDKLIFNWTFWDGSPVPFLFFILYFCKLLGSWDLVDIFCSCILSDIKVIWWMQLKDLLIRFYRGIIEFVICTSVTVWFGIAGT